MARLGWSGVGAAPRCRVLTPTRIRLTMLVFLVGTWELAADLEWLDLVFSSSPSRVARALIEFLRSGDWYWHVYVSVAEFLVGLAWAILIGVPLGLVLARRPAVYRTLDPFIMGLNSTPRTALIPLVVLWCGIGIYAKAIVVLLGAVFPIIVTTLAGARATDRVLVRMAHSLMGTERDVFLKVILPSSLPYVLDGIRQGVGRALIGVVVAEMYVSQAGLGNLIMNAAAVLNTDQLIFLAFTISLLGFGAALGLDRLEWVLCPWHVRRQ